VLLLFPLSRLVKFGSWALYGDRFATEREVLLEPAEVSLSDEPGRRPPLAALSGSGEAEEFAERGRGRRGGGSIVPLMIAVVPEVNQRPIRHNSLPA
jgi:hypothetical protein